MDSVTADKRYAAAVQAIGHLRSVLGNLLIAWPVDVKGALDATSWVHIEKIYGIKESDLAAIDVDEILGKEAIESWHHEYPWSGRKQTLANDENA